MTHRNGDPCPSCNLDWVFTECPECGWRKSRDGDGNIAISGGDEGADTRSEKEIEAAIMRVLTDLQWTVYKTSQPQRPVGMSPGIADLYVVGYGVTAWLECKAAKGRQSEAQRMFQEVVEENGGIYAIVRDETEAVEWARKYMPLRAA